MTHPISPDAYCPRSIEDLKELLADAIEREVRKRKITAVEVRKYHPSIRKGDMTIIESGFGALFGVNKLAQIAEAIGLRINYSIRGGSE